MRPKTEHENIDYFRALTEQDLMQGFKEIMIDTIRVVSKTIVCIRWQKMPMNFMWRRNWMADNVKNK